MQCIPVFASGAKPSSGTAAKRLDCSTAAHNDGVDDNRMETSLPVVLARELFGAQALVAQPSEIAFRVEVVR